MHGLKNQPKSPLMIDRRRVTTLEKAIEKLEKELSVKKADLEATKARVAKMELTGRAVWAD